MKDLIINKNNMGERLLKAVVVCVMMAFLAVGAKAVRVQAAAPSVTIKEINYENSTIVVQMNSRDNLLYISTSAMKKWEFVQTAKDANNCVTLDISWISASKAYVLAFKGDYSTTPVTVTIPKQVTNFKVSYNLFTGDVTQSNNAGGRTVEWRKKEAFNWNEYDADSFKDEINAFIANGATIMFRLAPESGNGTNPGNRPSKEYALTIPKKTAAPSIKIDDEHMTIFVTKGMEYRYADENGNPDENDPTWKEINKTEEMLLANIAGEAMRAEDETSEGDYDDSPVYIQFRTKATSTKQMSNICTVKIPAQDPWTETDTKSCSITYTSSTTFNIVIAAASPTYQYEYCIINSKDQAAGTTINNFEDITWKHVSSKDPVTINKDNDNVDNGSKIYVRKAAYLSLGETGYELASPIHELVSAVNYPGDISTDSDRVIWLQTVAGVCTPSNPEGYLSFDFYSATENVIEEIRFVDAYAIGTTRATLKLANGDFKSIVERNSSTTDENKRYKITTTIMNTAALDQFAVNDGNTCRRGMLAYIKQRDSSEEFKSTFNKGVGLYIHPATTVDNPSSSAAESESKEIARLFGWQNYNYDKDKVGFTTKITRIVNSNRYYREGLSDKNWDASQFRIKLNFGTKTVPERGTEGILGGTDVAVTCIKYDGITFIPESVTASGAACTVEYAYTKSDSKIGSEDIRTAILTINADVIEKNAGIDDRNVDTPVVIYLNNGEVLKNVLTMNLQETATLTETGSWTITEKSLTEEDKSTTTASNGSTTVTATEHVDRTIELTEYAGITNVSLLSVTWKGHSVCSNIKRSGNKYTMNLSNKEINKIDVTSTESDYLIFNFDNGFKITTGWKLTINPSAND